FSFGGKAEPIRSDQPSGRDSTFGGGRGPGGPGGPGGRGPGGPGGFRGGGGGGPRGSRGPGGPGGGFGEATGNKRYNLSLSISARNILNHENLGMPIGNLSSPLFGRSNSLASFFGGGGGAGGGAGAGGPGFGFGSAAGNRRVELQLRFSF